MSSISFRHNAYAYMHVPKQFCCKFRIRAQCKSPSATDKVSEFVGSGIFNKTKLVGTTKRKIKGQRIRFTCHAACVACDGVEIWLFNGHRRCIHLIYQLVILIFRSDWTYSTRAIPTFNELCIPYPCTDPPRFTLFRTI